MKISMINNLSGLGANSRPGGSNYDPSYVPPVSTNTSPFSGGFNIPTMGYQPCTMDKEGVRCQLGVIPGELEPGWTQEMVAQVNSGLWEDVVAGATADPNPQAPYQVLTWLVADRATSAGAPDILTYLAKFPWASKQALTEFKATGSTSMNLINPGAGTGGATTDEAEGLSTGVKVGIAVGAVAVVGLLTFILLKRRRK